MRAIGFTEFGGPEVFQVLELDEPHAGDGQVRIRVRAAAVNPSDTGSRSGLSKRMLEELMPGTEYPPPPYVVGWDVAGVIDEVGPGVRDGLQVGDDVCAITLSMGITGGYAEYVVVPAESVTTVPAGADHVAACTLPMNGLTARLALDRLDLNPGSTVAVTGAAGATGGYVVQLAKADGLRVIADASDSDEDLVRDLGADIVVRRGPDIAEEIRKAAPEGVDGLVDGSIQDDAVAGAVRDGGAIATLRFYSGSTERGLSWHPVIVTDYLTNQVQLDRLRRHVESGELTLRVAGTYPAEEAEHAHRRLEAGGVRGRLVLTF